jgi:hypothetical protein
MNSAEDNGRSIGGYSELAPITESAPTQDSNHQTSLAPVPITSLAPSPITPTSFAEVRELATLAVKSGLLSEAISTPEAAFVIIATGLELGLSPMQSLRGIHVIEGKPVLSADLLVALAKRSPDCVYFRLVESTYERATYETMRRGDPKPTTLTWTLEDARRADLVHKRTWKAHPAAMLRARCAAALARAVFPDLLLGVYEESEGEEIKESNKGRSYSRGYSGSPDRPKKNTADREDNVEILRPTAPKKSLREQLLLEVYRASDSTKLRYIVKTASGAKKAGALLDEEFQEIVTAAKARHQELTVPLLDTEDLRQEVEDALHTNEEESAAPF